MAYEDYADYTDSDSETVTGTSNYNTGSSGTDTAVNASANPITSNSGPVDASGGNGSIPSALQQTAVQGLNDAVVSAAEFGLGSLTDLFSGNAAGQTTTRAAPSTSAVQATAGSKIPGWALLAAIGIGAYFLLREA